MKYVIFSMVVIGVIPMIVMFCSNIRFMRYAMLGLVLPIIVFEQVSINFISHEWYRGTSRGLEISVIYLVAFSIFMTTIIRWGKPSLFPDWGSKIYLMYFIMSLMSFTNAAKSLFSFFELWKMMMMYLLFITIYNYVVKTRDFKIVFIGLDIIVIVAFLWVVKEHVSGIWQVRSFFPHQNSMSMYLTVLGTLCLARYIVSDRHSMKLLMLFLMASACVFRTYSRGAIACYPFGCAITGTVCLLLNVKPRKMFLTMPLVVFGILGVLLSIPRIIERFETASPQSGNTRIELAQAAKNMIEDEPMLGVGLNNWGIKINYPYTYGEPLKDFAYEEGQRNGIVETIYLLVAAECGIPALVLLLAWFFFYWTKAFILVFKTQKTKYFFLPAGLLGGLSSIYSQSVLEWVLKQQINFMQLMICFALLAALGTIMKQIEIKEKEKRLGTLQKEEYDGATVCIA
ncbi:MAG: O-antigen ligase family protein [Victivallales bacterium]|nr:O-antigen ligase family protein [Victivallales bacterium]